MFFTLCFSLYAGLVTVTPIQSTCELVTLDEVNRTVARCKALDKDPITTCEARRAGALKWFVTVRILETNPEFQTPPAGPIAPALPAKKGGRA